MKLFMKFPEGKPKALTLSYDDGVEQDIHLLEILDRYGIKSTFNLNSRYYEKDEYTYEPGRIHRPLGKTRAVEVFSKAIENGHEVATHGYTHPFLEQLPEELAVYDMIRDRERLEELFGGIIRGCAYPYGTFNDTAVDALRACGLVYARNVVSSERFDIPTDWLRMPATCHHKNKNLMELADKFVNKQPPKQSAWLFYLWGHSYEFESDNNWNVIEEFCEKVSHKDDIWYASNIEIYDYIDAYHRLRFALNGKTVHNPTATTVWFEKDGKICKILPGETLKL